VAYGSYDERLRLVDVRSLRQEGAEYRTVGGGVWRAKWHPHRDDCRGPAGAPLHGG